MKILFFLIFLVLFSGCSKESEKEKSIEILSYCYEWNHNNKMIINYRLYAKIYPNGKTEILKKYNFADDKAMSFESKLDKRIVDSVFILSCGFEESHFKVNYDSTSINICDAPIVRIKIKCKEKKDFSFNFSECNKEEKYIIFLNLYSELEKKYLKAEKSRTTNHNLLLQKEKEFEKFVIHKDSLQLPFPSPPRSKINEVKFVSPKSNSKLSP